MIRALIPTVVTCGALAVGLALGAGPLENATQAQDPPVAAPTPAAADQAASFGRQWAAQAASPMYAGKLAGRRIAVVTMPGADPKVVQGLLDEIAVAKGIVSARVAVAHAMLDTSQQTMLGTLGQQFSQQSDGLVPASLPTYGRIGAILGLAVAGPSPTTTKVTTEHTRHGVRRSVRQVPTGASRTTAQETITAGKLATIDGGKAPADLVLVVLGDGRLQAGALHDLLAGLGSKLSGGVVVAGDTATARPGGTLAGLRATHDGDKVLTVDGAETPYGRIASVLGLVRQLTTQGGDFGASGIDGLLP